MSTTYSGEESMELVMRCPNETSDYPIPDKMIDDNGHKLYAYVTLIMLNNRYIPGAIVLAFYLKKIGSLADLVVLVTPDINEDGRRVLGIFFDKVIEVPLIHVPNWRTRTQKHRMYLDYVFTKYNLFNLTQYKKIILIDADAIVLKHPDHLFTLNAPAGCLLEDKSDFIYYDSKGNYVLPENKKIKWYENFCDCCGHGKLIPKEYTDRVIKNHKDSGIGGGIQVLEPKKGELERMLKELNKP